MQIETVVSDGSFAPQAGPFSQGQGPAPFAKFRSLRQVSVPLAVLDQISGGSSGPARPPVMGDDAASDGCKARSSCTPPNK